MLPLGCFCNSCKVGMLHAAYEQLSYRGPSLGPAGRCAPLAAGKQGSVPWLRLVTPVREYEYTGTLPQGTYLMGCLSLSLV